MKLSIFTLNEFENGHCSSKKLADYLVKFLDKSKKVYDFGCGNGYYISELEKSGFQVLGFEGTPGSSQQGYCSKVIELDLSEPIGLNLEAGTCMSLEVAEHIDKEYEDIFVDNVTKYCQDTLVISWATPGQGGLRHVNEQPNEYVISLIESKGFKLLKEPTAEIRSIAGKDLSYFNNTIFIFKKEQ